MQQVTKCRIGLHNWNKWQLASVKTNVYGGIKIYQLRKCESCGKNQVDTQEK